MPMAAPSWQNLLILQTSFLGDTVLTLPLIAEVKATLPGDMSTVWQGNSRRSSSMNRPSRLTVTRWNRRRSCCRISGRCLNVCVVAMRDWNGLGWRVSLPGILPRRG